MSLNLVSMITFGTALLAAAAGAAWVLLTAATAPAPSAEFSWNDYARPHRLVDIGGRRLNLLCMGVGSPTVILDGGLGDDITGWRKVQSDVARTTRVCAYDRAGYGFSDPGPLPRTAEALSDDLQGLLRAARLRSPYVMVGQSLAGLHVRLFVDKHLRDVAGVVLVEPSFEHQVAKYEEVTPAFRKSADQQLATFRSCIDAMSRATPPPGSKAWKDCIGDPEPDLPASVTNALVARISPDTYRMALSEVSEFEGRSSDQIDASRRPWGDMPLIVLTAGGTTPTTDHDQALRNQVWLEAHERIAALSTRGVSRVIANATHRMQISRPEAVIGAIDEILIASRSRNHR
jgi:pimeloyl-ACP methyl ester carboxylesterase